MHCEREHNTTTVGRGGLVVCVCVGKGAERELHRRRWEFLLSPTRTAASEAKSNLAKCAYDNVFIQRAQQRRIKEL